MFMRRLVISNLYPPNSRGGAEALVKREVEAFLDAGDEVMVFSCVGDGDSFGKYLIEDVRFRLFVYEPDLPYFILGDSDQPLFKRLIWHFRDLVGASRSAEIFEKVLEDFKPDMVISHNLRGMDMSFVRVLRESGVRWAHVLHDIQLVVPSGMFWLDRWSVWQSRLVIWLYAWWTRRMFGSPDLVVSPSRALMDEHLERGFFSDSKMRVLRNPLDTLKCKEMCNLCCDAVDCDGGCELRVLYVGQLVDSKGVMVLTDAISSVNFGLALTVVGEGEMFEEMSEIFSGLSEFIRVDMKGGVSHDYVLDLMRDSDVLVVPSVIFENCPGVVMEAQACSLPVIASNQGGLVEYVHDSGLFKTGDAVDLSARLRDALNGQVETMDDENISVGEYIKVFDS